MTKKNIKQKLKLLTTADESISGLVEEIEKTFNVIIFGGAVRDMLLDRSERIRDLDLVLYPLNEGETNQEEQLEVIIKKMSSQYLVKQNRFNGYKLIASSTTLDIWLLKNTWAFQNNLLPVSIENLLKSVYLNIDAYAWDCTKEEFISNCNNVKIRKIDIVMESNPCEELNLIRAMVYSDKYKILLSKRIINKIEKMWKEWSYIENDVYKAQMSHFGRVVKRKKDIIETLVFYGRMQDEKYML